MKKFILILCITMPLIMAKEIKIGLIDANRVLVEYQASAAASAEFNTFVNTYRDSAAVLKRNIEQLQTELEAQKLVLSEETRLRKLDETEALTKAYNRFLQDVFGTGGKIEQKNDELMAPLLKKINDAVQKIAEQEGFQIVLDLSEGVYYASSELDLTDLVINELNLEYGPTTVAAGETKKVIVIFPFREENPDAANAKLGQRCQTELYNVIRAFSTKYTIISQTSINMEIVRRQLGVNIDETQAYSIALTLLSDYLIIGKVSKFATKIDYSVSIKDVNKKQEISRRNNSVTEEIKLPEALNNDLRELLDLIEQ